ncbi:MAG: hypothetical protein IJL67_08595 [Oscillospiraceae bacterium]|nr:hypothetical protein [Oscillospiraceae bacterium]
MGMVVRTNMAALGANNSLAQASKAQQSGMQKLYTGFKINAAKDDASGLAISEKMKNQIKALDTAKDNCEDGANMIQTAEGYMKETHDILTRMTELAEKSANGLLDNEDRTALQNEMDQLCSEIDRMATTANFNGKKLLNGDLGSNGKVEITSDATGNHYKVSDTAPNTGELKAGTVTTSNTAVAELSGSAKDDLTAKISAAAEATAKAAASREVSYTDSDGNTVKTTLGELASQIGGFDVNVAVNKSGDIVTELANKTSQSTVSLTGTVSAGGALSETQKQELEAIGFDWNDTNLISDPANLNNADVTKINDAISAKNDEINASNALISVYNNEIGNDPTPASDLATPADTTATPEVVGGSDVYDAANNKDGYSLISVNVKADTANTKATLNEGIKLQIGESSTAADKMNVKIGSFHTDTLLGGINGFTNKTAGATGETDAKAVAATKVNETATYDKGITIDISDQNKASAAADAIRQVSNYVSDQRGTLGAQQNRLEHTVNNLATASENTTAAKSRILDTDMAKEMMEYTSKNVIAQAAQSMLAQANSQPQNVLSLLQ